MHPSGPGERGGEARQRSPEVCRRPPERPLAAEGLPSAFLSLFPPFFNVNPALRERGGLQRDVSLRGQRPQPNQTRFSRLYIFFSPFHHYYYDDYFGNFCRRAPLSPPLRAAKLLPPFPGCLAPPKFVTVANRERVINPEGINHPPREPAPNVAA